MTGIDDSAVVAASEDEPDSAGQIALIDELIADLQSDIVDMGEEREALDEQLERLDASAAEFRVSVEESQRALDEQIGLRHKIARRNAAVNDRIDEIVELNARFMLLGEHYDVDLKRLGAIHESGSLFAFVERVSSPLCGAGPWLQHVDDDCEGNAAVIVEAATAEIGKILALQRDLEATVSDLGEEQNRLALTSDDLGDGLDRIDGEIRSTIAPDIEAARSKFTDIIETRARVRHSISLFDRLEKLERRREDLDDSASDSAGKTRLQTH